jgi:hypothetical protein
MGMVPRTGCAAGQPFEAHAFLVTPFAQAPLPQFFDLLRDIFASLFDWLDRLEAVLTTHLRAKTTWASCCRCVTVPTPFRGRPFCRRKETTPRVPTSRRTR